jgi:inosine/xanthosine triphosphate pyrophosphatase family protein/dephospho-CoA kinase
MSASSTNPTDPNEIHLPGAGPRRLRLYFYTSSVDKFLQARHVLSRFGYVLEHFQRTQPYGEDYSRGKDELLASAIEQVVATVGRNVLFFVEDTSLRVEALSSAGDFPGLAVKEWFAVTTFEDLDRQVKQAGGDRRATIKSGIALYVPGRARPVYFYGETNGHIAPTQPSFTASKIHPWLSANTFDGWFVPNGSQKRLGEMGADESLRLHFRALALRELAERMAEYSAIINLPPSAYFVQRPAQTSPQLALFREPVRRFLVFGERAAGKTTFGEFASNNLASEHFEASTVIRLYHHELDPNEPDLSAFAARLHAAKGDDLVIRALVDQYGFSDAPLAIITGLRKFEELIYLARAGVEYQMVYIQAGPRTRYDRYVRRAREHNVMSYDDFLKDDAAHAALLRYVTEFADIVVQNEYDLDHYLAQVEYVIRGGVARPQGIVFRQGVARDSLLLPVLEVVSRAPSPLSPVDISSQLSRQDNAVSADSVARILRETPSLFTRVSLPGVQIAYEAVPEAASFIALSRERGRRS